MKKTLADFKNLTGAEAKLLAWLQAGNRKSCEISKSVPDGPGDDVTLRATFIRYLALGGCDACRLPETGLRVRGAHIDGDERNSEGTKGLDLEGATLPHDLELLSCHIPDPIILRSAKVANLFLDGSDVRAAITADRLQAGGDVFLRGATIAGEVRLLGARLSGDLNCASTELHANRTALSCDRMQAEGNIILDKTIAAGEVRLLGARIKGDLYCMGARLHAKPKSLNCDGAIISGVFFLGWQVKLYGCLDLTAVSFGAINDDPTCWPPELILDRCRYGAFLGRSPTEAQSRLKWLALQQPTSSA